MSDTDPREIFGNIGEMIWDMEPELVELLEDGEQSPEFIQRLLKLQKDTKELKELVYKEFYKDEVH